MVVELTLLRWAQLHECTSLCYLYMGGLTHLKHKIF